MEHIHFHSIWRRWTTRVCFGPADVRGLSKTLLCQTSLDGDPSSSRAPARPFSCEYVSDIWNYPSLPDCQKDAHAYAFTAHLLLITAIRSGRIQIRVAWRRRMSGGELLAGHWGHRHIAWRTTKTAYAVGAHPSVIRTLICRVNARCIRTYGHCRSKFAAVSTFEFEQPVQFAVVVQL